MVVNAAKSFDDKLNFGTSHDLTLKELQLLSGDLSYANLDQSKWDEFGNQIEPMASHFPWMFAPGNHEAIGLFM